MQVMLTQAEVSLLLWLAKEDVSQYGECHGLTLNQLLDRGLAEVLGEETETSNPFVAKGRGIMYRAVRLTDTGREVARELQK